MQLQCVLVCLEQIRLQLHNLTLLFRKRALKRLTTNGNGDDHDHDDAHDEEWMNE